MTFKDIKRFWSKVNKHSGVFAIIKGKKSECWLWTGGHNPNGYGGFYIEGTVIGAHVASYMISKKLKKKPRLHVLHYCDNPPCIRPSHLFKGTHQDNMTDRNSKGRQVTRIWNALDRKKHSLTMKKVAARGDNHGSRLHPDSRPTGIRNGTHTHPESVPRGDKHWTYNKKQLFLTES